MSDLGQQTSPYTAFSQAESLQGDNISVFAGSVLGCYTYSHMAPIHLDHLGFSIAVRKSNICQPVGFFQEFEVSELSLREFSGESNKTNI